LITTLPVIWKLLKGGDKHTHKDDHP
jgi:hypothetical protein